MRRNIKAQSTMEYVIIFAAIVVAVLAFAYAKMKPAVENMMDKSAAKITSTAFP